MHNRKIGIHVFFFKEKTPVVLSRRNAIRIRAPSIMYNGREHNGKAQLVWNLRAADDREVLK